MDYMRVLDKFDRLVYSGKFDEACLLLENQKRELFNTNKTYELIGINNELIGFYRKQNREEDCLRTINDTLTLLSVEKEQNSKFFGTVYINIGTGYTFLKRYLESEENFNKAYDIYLKVLPENDTLFGALFNNIACMFLAKKDYIGAREFYTKAVKLAEINNQMLDKAMSLVGVADTYDMTDLDNEKVIDGLLSEAFTLVENYPVKDDYFKFVCSKLYGNYSYYGYIFEAEKLKELMNERD